MQGFGKEYARPQGKEEDCLPNRQARPCIGVKEHGNTFAPEIEPYTGLAGIPPNGEEII